MDLASLPLDIPDTFGSALTFQIATAGNEQRTQSNGKKRVASVLLDEPKSSRSIVCVGAEDAPTYPSMRDRAYPAAHTPKGIP